MVLPHLSIGMALYHLKFGIEPRISWDWKQPKSTISLERLNHKDALSVATRIYKAWEIAKENIEKAQGKMIKSVNQHHRSID